MKEMPIYLRSKTLTNIILKLDDKLFFQEELIKEQENKIKPLKQEIRKLQMDSINHNCNLIGTMLSSCINKAEEE